MSALPSSLRERRVLFSTLVSKLVLWINEEKAVEGWSCCYDEVTIHTPRTGIQGGKRITVADGVHKEASFHHAGLAADINLYINGTYIAGGDHPAWREVGRKWESLHPAATSGFRFHDSNHVSFGEGDRSTPF